MKHMSWISMLLSTACGPSPIEPSAPSPEPPSTAAPAPLANTPAPATPTEPSAKRPQSACAKFRACYNAGLRVDRTMEGCVIMTARISPTGTVDSSRELEHDGLSEDVVACLVDVLRGATFSAPGGVGSTLNVPV